MSRGKDSSALYSAGRSPGDVRPITTMSEIPEVPGEGTATGPSVGFTETAVFSEQNQNTSADVASAREKDVPEDVLGSIGFCKSMRQKHGCTAD